MYGGAGGRGSRASVATLDGLRNVMRNEPSGPAEKAAAAPRTSAPAPRSAAPAGPPVPADDKKTMRGLNERLSGYLGRVRELEKANKDLADQIKDILAKRAAPDGRDWDEIEKPLDDLRKKVRVSPFGIVISMRLLRTVTHGLRTGSQRLQINNSYFKNAISVCI